jgi:hypothetical protein
LFSQSLYCLLALRFLIQIGLSLRFVTILSQPRTVFRIPRARRICYAQIDRWPWFRLGETPVQLRARPTVLAGR